ncbi:PD-(D/E)XK nuclease-like domain-containing protein [Enterovibrio norvegicus]|uniref:PD-(D/E)XK nuclease-like domain-containing protein n=1 Tax=Enterovibrio norvegicus TaxID=188144 RepID=UPI00352D03C2
MKTSTAHISPAASGHNSTGIYWDDWASNIAEREDLSGLSFGGSTVVSHAYDDYGKPAWVDAQGHLKEGIYLGLENDVYHAIDAVSSSKLKVLIKEGPNHYHRAFLSNISRRRRHKQQQDTLDAGTYGHELILEPKGFYERYFRLPLEQDYPDALCTHSDLLEKVEEMGLSIAKSSSKQELATAIQRYAPEVEIFCTIYKEIVNHPDNIEKKGIDGLVWDDSHRVANTCSKDRCAAGLIKDGRPEVTFIAYDADLGLWVKCRFDWLRYDGIAIDVKTTKSASEKNFSADAGKYGYHLQEAFYKYVARLLGVELDEFLFIAIEYAESDSIETYDLCEKSKSIAVDKVADALQTLKQCLSSGIWRSYSSESNIRRATIPTHYL